MAHIDGLSFGCRGGHNGYVHNGQRGDNPRDNGIGITLCTPTHLTCIAPLLAI